MAEQTYPSAISLFRVILKPESRFYWLVFVYGIAVSALSLALPLSVQVLISTVANAALEGQVIVLSMVLLGLLGLSSVFIALQIYVMELFERRFFSRIVSDAALRLAYARYDFIESINREELMNRYFDVMTVQKNLPPLLTGGLASLLQMSAGIALTSFYHPIFLLFNAIAILLAYLVYRVFDRGAAYSSITLSTAKYGVGEWLETLARANAFFKSSRTVEYAVERTLAARDRYITEHKRHFRYAYAQILGFLVLYTTTSAALLGVGGILVIRGQLTIGQLVAAELILSGVFYGLSRIGYYLELYYDLYAAMYKLRELYLIPHEHIRVDSKVEAWEPSVKFDGVRIDMRDRDLNLDFEIPAGATALIKARSTSQVEAVTDLIQYFRRPDSGQVLIGAHAIDDFNTQQMRNDVQVVESTLLPDCSIAEYMRIADPEISRSKMRRLLEVCGLDTSLPELVDGLDHELTPHGYPLSLSGVVKLKVAYALASEPRILVLTPLFDTLSQEARRSIIHHLRSRQQTTVLCFTHRQDLNGFDCYWFLNFDEQRSYPTMRATFEAYDRALANDDAPDDLEVEPPTRDVGT